MTSRKVLVTGASGFIGHALCASLTLKNDLAVVGASRVAADSLHASPELGPEANWSDLVSSCDVVIHTAARAHIMKNEVDSSLGEYRRANIDGTLNLARQSAAAGVKRFIFISSIGVNGNINTRPFTENDSPNPAEPYAQSKWKAEQGLWEIQRESGMEVVIIRPPLVYGPGAPGNFGSLLSWIEKGVPLPLGSIKNQRSLIALDNLVDLIITCIDHPAAANEVFLAGDGEDLSTTELLHGVAKAMGKPTRLISVPEGILMSGATLVGKKAVAQRLLGSLQVDISKARNVLGWEPPLSVEEGLRRCFPDRSS